MCIRDRRYGTYIPFYEKESEFIKSTLNEDDPAYDPEEINIADVKFLLWHHYPVSYTHLDVYKRQTCLTLCMR